MEGERLEKKESKEGRRREGEREGVSRMVEREGDRRSLLTVISLPVPR